MDTLQYILERFGLKWDETEEIPRERRAWPLEIPHHRRGILPILFKELNFTKGAEIGVREGRFSELLCSANENLKLWCIDPWLVYTEYVDCVEQTEMNRKYEEAVDRLKKYNCKIVRKFSMDAIGDFEDGFLDFVYIDANHEFKYIVEDLCGWSKKVKSGGIVAGHDFVSYKKQCFSHVVEAVTGYVLAYRISPWFVVGKLSEKAGTVRDSYRSWFFVKN
jgi:hypothetical protein